MTIISYSSPTITEDSVILSAINNVSTSPSPPKSGGIGAHKIVLGLVMSCFAVFTISGNILVIVAVSRMRYLRSMTNYFIVSLAVADLLMGSIVMPFAVLAEVTPYWPFGQLMCDLWHAFDVLSSTASILNLCMIALERYWAIENPMTYSTKMTHRRCLFMVSLAWICSSCISFPAIIWWRYVQVSSSIPKCIFTDDRAYLLLSATISFYIPLIVMIIVYWRIYRTATNMIRSMNTGAKMIKKNGSTTEMMVLRIHRGGSAAPLSLAAGSRQSRCSATSSLIRQGRGDSNNKRGSVMDEDSDAGSTNSLTGAVSNSGGAKFLTKKLRKFALGRRLTKFGREQKAAKTLGIVMGIFIICWLPFFICTMTIAINKNALGEKVDTIFTSVTWLGYINSCVNPIIYAHSMRDFRRAFIKILCACCPDRQKTLTIAAMPLANNLQNHPWAPKNNRSASATRIVQNSSEHSQLPRRSLTNQNSIANNNYKCEGLKYKDLKKDNSIQSDDSSNSSIPLSSPPVRMKLIAPPRDSPSIIRNSFSSSFEPSPTTSNASPEHITSAILEPFHRDDNIIVTSPQILLEDMF